LDCTIIENVADIETYLLLNSF